MSKSVLPLWIFSLLLALGMAAAGRFAQPVAAAGASISGTVTDGSAQPIANITVALVRDVSAINGYPSWQYSNSTLTDGSGTYTFVDLEAGLYRIEFREETYPPTYATLFYNQTLSGYQATDVVVSGDETIGGIDAELPLRGALGGRVTDMAGTPLPNISVLLEQEQTSYEGTVSWNSAATASTDADGYYTAEALNPGNYRIAFLKSLRVSTSNWKPLDRSPVGSRMRATCRWQM